MRPERRFKPGMDGGLRAAVLVSPPLHLTTAEFLSKRWGPPHWALLIEGAIGIIAGVLTFAWPGITALVLLYLIAFWAIFTGIFEIIAVIRLRKSISNEWLLLLMGVLSLLFGSFILYAPGTGALAIVL